jgi:hypothetical protein
MADSNKPHLYFRNPQEGLVEYKSRIGGGNGNEGQEEEPDYTYMAEVFAESRRQFNIDIELRHSKRTIELPVHFDLIELEFFAAFDQPKYEIYYLEKFGLALLHLSNFNKRALFAIENQEKHRFFDRQILAFIDNKTRNINTHFDGKILFIKSFRLYSSNDMLNTINNYQNIHFTFMGKGLVERRFIDPQKAAFREYLERNRISHIYKEDYAELIDTSFETVIEIVNNFDFIYSTCSGSGAVILPGRYGLPSREFGFEIINANEDLPVIGIIDTGISDQTPLKSILIGVNGEFDTTGTGSFVDESDHGTGVAAFAAFGNKLIPDYKGEVKADAKLLSIKILNGRRGAISQSATIDLIRKAHEEYKVRIFTLTIGYTDFPLKDNQEFSEYAKLLDKVSSELDILIFISTTNHIFQIQGVQDYPVKFLTQNANIAPPAESMNNITIGAIADNFENSELQNFALSKTFPAIYSRKLHYNFDDEDTFNAQTANHYFRKPDILTPGGDYTEVRMLGEIGYDDGSEAGIEILSSDLHVRTFKQIGTSYATPIAANMAAKLVSKYPNLDMQTIKALLINGSSEIETGSEFRAFSNNQKKRIMGYGIPDIATILYSDDNKATLIIEDKIYPGYIKSFPVFLPEYLNTAKRKIGLLKITATLCFKFTPKQDNQLLYCPYHVTFAISKNLDLSKNHIETRISKEGNIREVVVPDGLNGNSSKNIALNSTSIGWVQDYFIKRKLVSNVQKISFNVKKENIINEQNCFKIAINSAFNKLLTEAEKEPFQQEIHYSLVITIEQIPAKNETLNSLYNELQLINNLEAIAEADLEAEV